MAQRSLKSLCLIAAALLLAAGPLAAMKVGRVTVVKTAHGHLLQVQTDGMAVPRLEALDGRLVLVVPSGQRNLKALALGAGPVARIRFGMEGSDLHIVLDLRERVSGRLLRVDSKGFTVALTPSAPALRQGPSAESPALASGAAAPRAVTDAASTPLESLNPAQVGYTYRVVDLSLGGDDKHSELIVSADGPASYSSSVLEAGRLLRLDFLNSTLAWSGDEKTLRDDSISGVGIRQLLVGGESRVRVDIRLTGKLDYAFKRDANQLVVRLVRPAKAEAPVVKGNMDTPVSLDVQGADLVGVLKTLCEQAGFDYQFTRTLLTMAPPMSVVTMKVDQRPFREVLDTLLNQVMAKEVRLGNTIYMGSASEISTRRESLPVVSRSYEPKYLTGKQISDYVMIHYDNDDAEKQRILKGIVKDPRDPLSVLLVGTPEEVSAWEGIIRQVDIPESGDDGDGDNQARTQVFHLNYLDNSNATLINGAIAQLYPEGEAPQAPPLIDAATRTLVVTTRPKYLRKIAQLLEKIDVRPLQVNIEGKIVEVDQSVASQLGVNWGITSSSTNPGVTAGNFGSNLTPLFTSQLTYGTVINAAAISAQIQAMVQSNKADLVSAPNITTIDNQPATISITQVQVYVQTTTTISNGVVTNASTFPTSNVPLTLVVTPKISRGDHKILMNINFQLTTTTGAPPASGAPFPTNQESAITNVSVNSGETFVIGGLVKQDNTEEVQKVPFLGDIPLLGLLFRFNQVNKAKSDVVIFIKPTIVGY